TSADFRRAVQRLISSSITKLICVSLKRLHLSRKSLGHYTSVWWLESDITAWIEARIAHRRAAA
ncbi:MAG TPA: hypothetical protein VEY92_02780, partial [Pseudoxanthomonas sp.]|nr:hypothetical protein [Pseudoxanthomonas sp.]